MNESFNSKKPITTYYKQAKEQADNINESLMRNIENLDAENVKSQIKFNS